MMTKASPQLQAIAADFTKFAHDRLFMDSAALDRLMSWGITPDSIRYHKLGYNPTTFATKLYGASVTFFHGFTVPIVNHYAFGRQLENVCCKPIDIEASSRFIFDPCFPIFERWRGNIVSNAIIIIVEDPLDAIMLECQLKKPFNPYVMALGRADKQIHDPKLRAKLDAAEYILVALNNTLAGNEFSAKLIRDLGEPDRVVRLCPTHKSPLMDWVSERDMCAWLNVALSGLGIKIPNTDAIEAEAEMKEQWLSDFNADLEANRDFYAREAPGLL